MLLPLLALGALAFLGVTALVRARSTTGAPSDVPTGTGAVPQGSGAPTPAAASDPALSILAQTLNAALHQQGAAASAPVLVQFQAAAGIPTTGVYDTATARALAAYVTSPPAPDVA